MLIFHVFSYQADPYNLKAYFRASQACEKLKLPHSSLNLLSLGMLYCGKENVLLSRTKEIKKKLGNSVFQIITLENTKCEFLWSL